MKLKSNFSQNVKCKKNLSEFQRVLIKNDVVLMILGPFPQHQYNANIIKYLNQ